MGKEYVLKLRLHEVTLIVDALESEYERASKIIATNGIELEAITFVKQSIDEILNKIDKRMVCIN
jgi:hypothetical protein